MGNDRIAVGVDCHGTVTCHGNPRHRAVHHQLIDDLGELDRIAETDAEYLYVQGLDLTGRRLNGLTLLFDTVEFEALLQIGQRQHSDDVAFPLVGEARRRQQALEGLIPGHVVETHLNLLGDTLADQDVLASRGGQRTQHHGHGSLFD